MVNIYQIFLTKIPFIFFLGNLLGIITSFFSQELKYIYLSVLIIYFSIILYEITKVIINKRNLSLYSNILIIPLMHLTYGFGTLIGVLKKITKK